MKYAIDNETKKVIYTKDVNESSKLKKEFSCTSCGDKCVVAFRSSKPYFFRHLNCQYLGCPNLHVF